MEELKTKVLDLTDRLFDVDMEYQIYGGHNEAAAEIDSAASPRDLLPFLDWIEKEARRQVEEEELEEYLSVANDARGLIKAICENF